MNEENFKYILGEDLKRYGLSPNLDFFAYLKHLFFYVTPGVKFSIVFRTCQHCRNKNKLLFYLFFIWLRRVKYKYGFDISYRAKIGKGLYIGHFGGIVIHGEAVIGDYCNISQGITIGVLNRGKNIGVPKIGNRVFIGPNAVILGGITVGDNVLIGANAMVNFDIPDKAVVAPTKSEIISFNGSENYV